MLPSSPALRNNIKPELIDEAGAVMCRANICFQNDKVILHFLKSDKKDKIQQFL